MSSLYKMHIMSVNKMRKMLIYSSDNRTKDFSLYFHNSFITNWCVSHWTFRVGTMILYPFCNFLMSLVWFSLIFLFMVSPEKVMDPGYSWLKDNFYFPFLLSCAKQIVLSFFGGPFPLIQWTN